MIHEYVKGKKLLLIGGINPAADIIDLAHRNGVTVGVVDHRKGTYVKKLADYQYDLDVYNVEAITNLYLSEHYDGIIYNFNEKLGPIVSEICYKLGVPVPYTIEQLRMSTDKKFFKHTCMRYGIPVPEEYIITSEKGINSSNVSYPVIVKPVDSAGSTGVSVCSNYEELAAGYKKAIGASKKGDIIAEQYLAYDEINVTYIAQDGDIQLAAIHDRYFNTSQEGVLKVPDLYIYPSRYVDLYLKKYNQMVVNMLKGIGVRNGSLFIQAVVKGDQIYFYEAGMRLNGCKTYQILEYENDYNTFEHLMLYALTGSMGKYQNFSPKFKHWYATVNVLGKPGAVINRIEGVKALETYPWLIHIAKRFQEGDRIPIDSAGTLIQDTTRIHVIANTKKQLMERIKKVNELYQLLNVDGENIILAPHDLEEIYKGLDYEL